VLVVVMGAVEYLGDDGSVVRRFTAQTLLDLYRTHCAKLGIAALDLVD
jgi:hypothetical protein